MSDVLSTESVVYEEGQVLSYLVEKLEHLAHGRVRRAITV